MGQISGSGLFKAIGKGSGRVIATDGQKVATALVNVSDSDTKPGQLIIIPPQLSLVSGALQEFSAFVKSDSRLTPVIPAWRAIGNVGTIDSAGHFVATKSGSGEVEAIVGSLTARCQISVSSGKTEKVQIQPEKLSISAGKQQNFKVISQDSGGNLTDSKPEYYIAGNLGKIDEKGIFSAVKAGTGNIIAAVSSVMGKGDIEITTESLMEIRISPVAQDVMAGSLTKFSAFGKDDYGNLIPVNPVWGVIGTSGIGSVSSNGIFMAKKTGQCQVQARVGSIANTANIQVLASAPAFILVEPALLSISSKNDSPIQFLFKILDRFGNIPDSKNIQISWTATAGIGTIDPQTGLFINKKNETRTGYVTATAVINKGTETERTIRGRAAVILLPATKPLASITVTPNPATVIKGDTRKFTATGRDADGIEVFITPSWNVAMFDVSRATFPDAITTDGIFKATSDMEVGSSWKVLASVTNSEGQLIKGEANLNLVAGPLQSIEVACSNNSCSVPIKSGKIIQMEATGYDQFRNNVAISPEWKITGEIGTVKPDAPKNKVSFSAGKAGQGEVIASSDGKEGRIHLTVEPGSLVGIKISTEPTLPDAKIGASESNPLNIKSGSEIRFIATGQDSNVDELGKAKPVNTFQISPAWSLRKSDETIDLGTLATDGRFTGRKAGNGRIEAKIGSITATFYIRVIPGDLKIVKVFPSSLSIVSGANAQQFSALGYDAYGNQILNPGDIIWRVAGNIGNIDKNGLFTPVSSLPDSVAISGTVIASINGVESSASVTIVPTLGKLASIHITADPEVIPAGSQSIITIKGADEDGHPMTDFPPSVEITLSAPESLGTITPSLKVSNEWIFQAQRILPAERNGLMTASAKTEGETFTDSVTVKLVPGLLSKIAIEPESVIIPAGEERVFEASGYDQWGNPIELVSPGWSLSSSLGQLVQDAGNDQEAIFTASTAGQCQLIVRFQSHEGRADMTVTPGKLELITIEPTDLTIPAGSSHTFVSLGLDGYGNKLENLKLQWEIISEINIGTITDSGVFSAIKSGTGKLKATYKSGNIVVSSNESRIQVIPGPITSASIIIYKDGVKLETPYVLLSGVQYDLRLYGVDQWGNAGDQIGNVNWNVKSDTGALIIGDNPAIFATLFVGNAQITAKIGEIIANIDIEIAPYAHSISSAKGGSVSGPFGSIISIPTGALSADEIISIALSPSPGPAEGVRRVSHIYSFKPDGKVFNLPVELIVSYDTEGLVISTGIDPEKLSIYSYDKFNKKWVRVGGKISQESITANINYLSYFAIMQEDQGFDEPSDSNLKIMDVQLSPNVYFAPETNRLNIRYNINLPKRQVVNVTVEIYDIKGHLVKQLLEKSPKYPGWNADQWDGTDESGEIVKNGRYFVLITAETDGDKVSVVKHLAVFR